MPRIHVVRLCIGIRAAHALRPPVSNSRAASFCARTSGLRLAAHRLDLRPRTRVLRRLRRTSGLRWPAMRLRPPVLNSRAASFCAGPPGCAWLLSATTPDSNSRARRAAPDLQAAPGCSCGYDLRSSNSRAASFCARTSGLRLAAHAVRPPVSNSRGCVVLRPGPPGCAWLLMPLRPCCSCRHASLIVGAPRAGLELHLTVCDRRGGRVGSNPALFRRPARATSSLEITPCAGARGTHGPRRTGLGARQR